jgi:hypothetical protein
LSRLQPVVERELLRGGPSNSPFQTLSEKARVPRAIDRGREILRGFPSNSLFRQSLRAANAIAPARLAGAIQYPPKRVE